MLSQAEPLHDFAATTGKNSNLIKLLSEQELLEYFSCVWFTENEMLAIEVGKPANASTAQFMQLAGISGLVGVIPNPVLIPP